MPHSLRVRLKNLDYKGILTDRELNRLIKALDIVDNIEKIKAEIKKEKTFGTEFLEGGNKFWYRTGLEDALKIIDKYTKVDTE